MGVRRAKLPPWSEEVILTETDSAQRQLWSSVPQPANARRDVEPGRISADSAPTGHPAASFQRAPATGLDDHPSNAVRVAAIEEAIPIGSECEEEQLPEAGGEGDGQLWPGSDFKLEQYLAGSVYLWACGEHGEEGGGTASCVSRPEAAAAWVVLVVSPE